MYLIAYKVYMNFKQFFENLCPIDRKLLVPSVPWSPDVVETLGQYLLLILIHIQSFFNLT